MARPLLDVSDVLTDPDFVDTTLQCVRSVLSVDQSGIGSVTTTTLSFFGVVTSDQGERLIRRDVGEQTADTILIITGFRLLPGKDADRTADIVIWNGVQYTVRDVNDYSKYGVGFSEATCEKIPLSTPSTG